MNNKKIVTIEVNESLYKSLELLQEHMYRVMSIEELITFHTYCSLIEFFKNLKDELPNVPLVELEKDRALMMFDTIKKLWIWGIINEQR